MASSSAPPWRKLTAREEAVIVRKGTEAPFSGEYERAFAPGTY
jgi:peptide methionine sulfoxide reductase MsrB